MLRTLLCLGLGGCLPLKPGPDTGVPEAPTLSLDTEVLDFGEIALDGTARLPLTVSNLGASPLEVVLSTPWGGPYSADPERFTLARGESTQAWVQATPLEAGEFTDAVLVNSNDPSRPVVSIAVSLTVFIDADSDGWEAALDCDDEDPNVYPSAPERADGVDTDCDGSADRFTVSEALWTVSGTQPAAPLGAVPLLVGAPDLGGLLVGWPQGGEGGGALLGFDAAALASSPSADAAGLVQLGLEPGEEAGAALVLLGDLDGDGWAELALGAPGASDGQGEVRVLDLSGAYTSGGFPYQGRVWGSSSEGRLGHALGAADLDGDGGLDLVLGAPGDANTRGRVAVLLAEDHYTTAELDLGSAPVRVRGEQSGDALGQVLHAADLDGDGYADLVLCAPGAGDGSCWWVPGAASPAIPNLTVGAVSVGTWAGDSATPGLGGALASGDWDGDGQRDLAIGAGETALVYLGAGGGGALHPHDTDLTLRGGGAALASHPWGDAEALVVGAPLDASAGAGAGAVWLLPPPLAPGEGALGDLAPIGWTGAEAGDSLGAALSTGVDTSGDGQPELALGAPGAGGGVGHLYGVEAGPVGGW